jgi:hypothetical protein
MQNVKGGASGGVEIQKDLRRALSMFLKAMQGEYASTRARALELFRTDCMPEVQERLLDMLVSALDSAVAARREAASATLTAIGLTAMLPLTLRFLHARKPARRQQAVELLGAISLAHRLPLGYALARALGDRDPAVRSAAEEAWRALRAAHDERVARLKSSAAARSGDRRRRRRPPAAVIRSRRKGAARADGTSSGRSPARPTPFHAASRS